MARPPSTPSWTGLGLPTARTNDPLSGTSAQFRSSARDLAELYTHLGPRSREILYRHQRLDLLPRRLPHDPDVSDHGLTAPVRVFGKAGWGACELVDAGRFETDTAAWVIAGMARDLPDVWHRPDDVGPRTLADIGAAVLAGLGRLRGTGTSRAEIRRPGAGQRGIEPVAFCNTF